MFRRVFRRALHYTPGSKELAKIRSGQNFRATRPVEQRGVAPLVAKKVLPIIGSGFSAQVDAPPHTKLVIPGNTAFALGMMHAGYHAVDGYPGTPSTEVIDRCLLRVNDRIAVGWSVNEATAAGLGLGRSMAGQDTVVTMKIPGVFQAADVISSSASFNSSRGALVYYVVSDYIPSSTQHLVDPRFFFSSIKLPILEPSSHQSMYEMPRIAADMSRTCKTPVVILSADTLAHAEGLMETGPARTLPVMKPTDLTDWNAAHSDVVARNYEAVVRKRIPAIQHYYEHSELVTEIPGDADWAIIVNGNGYSVVREVLSGLNSRPSVLLVSGVYPLPSESIKAFAQRFPAGRLAIIEDGDRFLTHQIELLLQTRLISKRPDTPEVFLTPTVVHHLLTEHELITKDPRILPVPQLPAPIMRPPANCPGCPYIALQFGLTRLKGRGDVAAVFGDIGCSSLLPSLDTIVAMGVSDPVRQGFALSRPENAAKYISIIGDSAEAHTGLNGTRNALFKGTSGVKIVLDNGIVAMTGGQLCPTSSLNIKGEPSQFNLAEVLRAEGAYVVSVDAYSVRAVYGALLEALNVAQAGYFAVVILNGECLGIIDEEDKSSDLVVDKSKCVSCHNCEVCSGIQYDDDNQSVITPQCENCGGSELPVCAQLCPSQSSVTTVDELGLDVAKKLSTTGLFNHKQYIHKEIAEDVLPRSIRLGIRGIGGQGNLFFGKALTEIFSKTPIIDTNIIKGDTHGMSQLGGPVLSMFSCGDVGSPVPQKGTVDVLVAMEVSELLRPGFLELLKPGGTILVNRYMRKPSFFAGNYPSLEMIEGRLEGYKIIKVDASQIARHLGDKTERVANVVMLGVLSTISPFNAVPYENWLDALRNLSNSESVLQSNCVAFQTGVDVANGDYVSIAVQEVSQKQLQNEAAERRNKIQAQPQSPYSREENRRDYRRDRTLTVIQQEDDQIPRTAPRGYLEMLKARYPKVWDHDPQPVEESSEDSITEPKDDESSFVNKP